MNIGPGQFWPNPSPGGGGIPTEHVTVTRKRDNPFKGLGGGLISAGLGFAGSLLQKRWNKKALDDERLYNSPIMQMKRLEDAGLNPNLVYGQGVSGASGDSGRVGGDIPDVSIQAVDEILKFQEAERVNLTNSMLEQNIEAQRLDNQLKYLDVDVKSEMVMGGEASMMLENLSRRNKKLAREIGINEIQLKFLTNTLDDRQSEVFWRAVNASKDSEIKDRIKSIKDTEADLLDAQLDLYNTKQIIGILAQILGVGAQYRR